MLGDQSYVEYLRKLKTIRIFSCYNSGFASTLSSELQLFIFPLSSPLPLFSARNLHLQLLFLSLSCQLVQVCQLGCCQDLAHVFCQRLLPLRTQYPVNWELQFHKYCPLLKLFLAGYNMQTLLLHFDRILHFFFLSFNLSEPIIL